MNLSSRARFSSLASFLTVTLFAAPLVAPSVAPAVTPTATATPAIPPIVAGTAPIGPNTVVIPGELLPVGPSGARTARTVDDAYSAAAIAAQYMNKDPRPALARLSPARRTEIKHILKLLEAPVQKPGKSTSPRATVVVLGNGLNPDGSVHPNLQRRLEVARDYALKHPASPIITSGGKTEHGHVEAQAMKNWLVKAGISPQRIHVEGNSWSTISNAWHSAKVFARMNKHATSAPRSTALPRQLVIATTDSHLHRGVSDYRIAFGPRTTVYGLASKSAPVQQRNLAKERMSRYRDAVGLYIFPETVVADGLPPIFGAGIPRFW